MKGLLNCNPIQRLLTWGPQAPKQSMDNIQVVCGAGWKKNSNYIFTNL